VNSHPQTEQELLERAMKLVGQPLGNIIGDTHNSHKGAVGQWLEKALGADAGNAAKPDFTKLQIELKTLPIGKNGYPSESTFITAISLKNIASETWETSRVYHKIRRVLWVPVEADISIPLPERRIGQAFLWSPNTEQMATLKNDWTELANRITLGELETISARDGVFLQIRPKAADGQSLSVGYDEEGNKIKTLPRGFYLRANFTKALYIEVNKL
jgi:DNA mismatch repair protein MutH